MTAASALAQVSDRSFTVVSRDCAGIQWSEATLAKFPNIGRACQSVEERDGRTYVRFSGRVEQNINRGEQLRINFRQGDTMTLTPPANTTLFINGRETPVANLRRGDQLNFRIPDDQLVAQVAQDETPQPRYVVVPIVVREVVREPAPEQAASLPHTASDLPLLALGGFMLLGLGAGMTVVRMKR
ncbi:MAG TPA: hypothetical protein VKB34_13445 [Povalibacter sp.]|nr:hypothetical protein [Povalibacter sp.]